MPLVLIVLTGCAETQLAIFAAKEIRKDVERDDAHDKDAQAPRYKVGKPYQVAGLWYYPHVDPKYNETGIASWYGEPFHGQRTANGDIYNMNAMTAAHKTLPMPTEVEVTNLGNGRSVVLTVNDRGPFVPGRIIDVSHRAATLLGFVKDGTAKVRVKALKGGSDERIVTYQATPENQKTALPAVPREKISAVAIKTEPATSAEQAVTKTDTKKTDLQTTPVAPAPVVTKAPIVMTPTEAVPTRSSSAVIAAAQPDFNVDSQSTVANTAIVEGISDKPVEVKIAPVKPTAMFVQAGTFAEYTNANKLRARLSAHGPITIQNVMIGDIEMFRVRAGPYSELDAADQMLRTVLETGLIDAKIIVDEVP